jgi:two-component system, NarL family, response regulator DesR
MRALTDRQLEVLELMAEGYTTNRIAIKLSCAPDTVRTHRNAIFDRLDVQNAAEAVATAFRQGWFK